MVGKRSVKKGHEWHRERIRKKKLRDKYLKVD